MLRIVCDICNKIIDKNEYWDIKINKRNFQVKLDVMEIYGKNVINKSIDICFDCIKKPLKEYLDRKE